jgi:hypothetical protein
MEMHNTMNVKRLWQLFKIDIFIYGRSYLSMLALFGGLALIASLVSGAQGTAIDIVPTLYPFVVFSGIIMASLSFSKLHERERAADYLLLPASTPEKYVSKLILTAIAFIAASLLFLCCLSFALSIINRFYFASETPVFNPFDEKLMGIVQKFLVAHSLYFFGSIYFKNKATLKTSLSIVTFACVLLIFLTLCVRVIYHDFIPNFDGHHNLNIDNYTFFKMYKDSPWPMVVENAELFFLIGVPLFFWSLGYIRLKEVEVR